MASGALLALMTAGCGSQEAPTTSQQPATATTPRAVQSSAGPPSGDAVADGRYIRPVVVTGLLVSPPEISGSPAGLGWDQALSLFESVTEISPVRQDTILGAATVTLTGIALPPSVPVLHQRLAWVGITWGSAIASCPLMTAPPKGTAAPRHQTIYTAVVIYGRHGAIVYTGRGTPPCGGALQGPSVAPAVQTVSVPWTLAGTPANGSVVMDYRAPSCATMNMTGGSGNVKTGLMTLSIDLNFPVDQSACGPAIMHQIRYEYVPPHVPAGVPTFRSPTFLHGPTGLVKSRHVTGILGSPTPGPAGVIAG